MLIRLLGACLVCLCLAGPVLAQDGDPDWRTVARTTDLDSLLLGGQGIVLAFEDTFSFDPGTADTLLVAAPRVTVAEVIEAIGRRMEYESYRRGDYEYTSLVTQVMRDEPITAGGDYEVMEFAQRYHVDRESGAQIVNLWERSRKYEDGEVTEDEVDEEISADFLPAQNSILSAMPFSPGGAGRYNYTILDRQLVGNNLIYKIEFAPKSRFEALPSGTIWVDYSNWVLRKVEARMIGAVPFPMFLKSVPVYRMSREQFGEFWFTTEVYMRINLRSVPLLPIPDNIEVRVSLQDIVINGAARSARDSRPGSGQPEITEEDIAGGFWLSAEANEDTLAAYWGQIGEQWQDEVTEEAVAVTLTPARIDSLTEVGSARLLDLREGSLWRLEMDFRKTPTFNRSQGFVPKVGVTLKKLGPDNPRLELAAGYGFANKRSVFSGELEVPLLRSRWHLAGTANGGKKFLGAQYQLLSLHLAGRKDSAMFGGDGRRDTRAASAFFYGSDPNNYYEERGFDGELRLRLTRGLALRGGGGYAEHRPWTQHTSWNVLGRRLSPSGNLAADYLDDSFAYAGADWNWGALSLDGDVTWHELSGFAAGSSLREIQVSGQLDLLDGLGNQWLLRGAHREFDGTAPVQWKSWLGDYGTLRGYEAGELTGDAGMHASLDARFGWDIWRAARVPVLKNWGLQPIGFLDWGHTWDNGEGANGPGEGERDWRLDVGLGFGKRFDLPGLGEFRNVRLYAAHPVAEGSEGRGWRFILAFEP